MARNIPAYPNPFDGAQPYANAYGYIAFLALDSSSGTGRLVLNVHPSAAAAAAGQPPVDRIGVGLGDALVPGTPTTNPDGSPGPAAGRVTFPSLGQLMGDQEFAAAFRTIQSKLEAALLAVPSLANSTPAA